VIEKRNNEMTRLQQINKSLDARARGELLDADPVRQHQALAVDAFPNARSISEALQKWYSTVLGSRPSAALGTIIVTNYKSDPRDGFEAVLKMKLEEPFDPRRRPSVCSPRASRQ
jgi:hypothetical protein